MGESLRWLDLPGRKESRIALRSPETDPADRADWPQQHQWLKEQLERFNRVFRPRVRRLNAEDWEAEEEEQTA